MGRLSPITTRRTRHCSSKAKVAAEPTNSKQRYVRDIPEALRRPSCPPLHGSNEYRWANHIARAFITHQQNHVSGSSGILPLLICRACCICHSFNLITISHLSLSISFFCAILKGGEVKVEYGQIITHDDKEDEALQLEGQGGGCGINLIKTKVRARYS
jgi:hypothetical protein